IIGLLIFWTYCGTLNFDEVFSRVRAPASVHGHGGKQESLIRGSSFIRGEVSQVQGDEGPVQGFELTREGGSQVLLFARNPHLHGDDLDLKDPDNAGRLLEKKVFEVHGDP